MKRTNCWQPTRPVWFQRNDDGSSRCFRKGCKDEAKEYVNYTGPEDKALKKEKISSCQMHRPMGWRKEND
jgi:hypothetical protein